MLLGVNIDHIATLRQARYATMLDSFNVEPSVLDAAYAAQRGGADSITLHVRGDRRHMQDADALSVRESVALPLNLEMGNTPEMVDFALRLKPDYICMVPEKREEITTEGGLDAVFMKRIWLPPWQEWPTTAFRGACSLIRKCPRWRLPPAWAPP